MAFNRNKIFEIEAFRPDGERVLLRFKAVTVHGAVLALKRVAERDGLSNFKLMAVGPHVAGRRGAERGRWGERRLVVQGE